MTALPRLILHPGFPKCATSSIQQGFVAHDHALARQIEVQFLGRNFLPNNGYPEVTRLMDEPDACATEIAAISYDLQERYFLSNEALNSNLAFLECLRTKFEIEKAVFSIRLPALQAISNYRYSGWFSSSFSSANASQATNMEMALSRLEKKLQAFQAAGISTVLCPLENSPDGFLHKFCRTAFGFRLQPQPGQNLLQANKSIGLAFASALHQELLSQTDIQRPNGFRRKLIKAAQAYKLDPKLAQLSIPDFSQMPPSLWKGLIQEYERLLTRYGVAISEAAATAKAAERSLQKLFQTPAATEHEMTNLKKHARILIQRTEQSEESV